MTDPGALAVRIEGAGRATWPPCDGWSAVCSCTTAIRDLPATASRTSARPRSILATRSACWPASASWMPPHSEQSGPTPTGPAAWKVARAGGQDPERFVVAPDLEIPFLGVAQAGAIVPGGVGVARPGIPPRGRCRGGGAVGPANFGGGTPLCRGRACPGGPRMRGVSLSRRGRGMRTRLAGEEGRHCPYSGRAVSDVRPAMAVPRRMRVPPASWGVERGSPRRATARAKPTSGFRLPKAALRAASTRARP